MTEPAAGCHHHSYTWPALLRVLPPPDAAKSIFEIGCGNGAAAAMLAQRGYAVSGVDISEEDIRVARSTPSGSRLHVGSAYDDLAARHGRFPVVISLDVVEHLTAPREFARRAFELLEPGGLLVVSTPYHGYAKNLLISLVGGWDHHADPLWDGGHIKLWSKRTLRRLFDEAGFVDIGFHLAGRVAPIAKTMIATARRPGTAPTA